MNFWESLAARMTGDLRESLWMDLPRSYNMGVDACDRLAIIHDREDDVVKNYTAPLC